MPRVANSAKKADLPEYKYEYTQASVHTDIGVHRLSQDEFNPDMASATEYNSQEEEATLQPTVKYFEESMKDIQKDENAQRVGNLASKFGSSKTPASRAKTKDAASTGYRNLGSLISSDLLQAYADESKASMATAAEKVDAGEAEAPLECDLQGDIEDSLVTESTDDVSSTAQQIKAQVDNATAATDPAVQQKKDVPRVGKAEDIAKSQKKRVRITSTEGEARVETKAKVSGNRKARRWTTGGQSEQAHAIAEWNLVNNRARRKSSRGKDSEVETLKLLFGPVWKTMSQKGWKYVKGTEFYIDFHYLAPGVKNPKEGILNETKFDDVPTFMRFVQHSFPQVFEDAQKELKVAEKTESPPKRAVPVKAKRKPQRKSEGAHLKKRKVSIVPKSLPHVEQPREKAEELWNCSWAPLWAILKEEYGWYFRKGTGLVSWVYVRQKGRRLNLDYFEDIDEVYKFIQARTGEFPLVYKNLVAKPKPKSPKVAPSKKTHQKAQPKPVKSKAARPALTKKISGPPPVQEPAKKEKKQLEWKSTWKALTGEYKWKYKAGSGLVSWFYIRTRFKNGREKEDYFTSPDDVLAYVESHKEAYPSLFTEESEDDTSDESSSEEENEESPPPSPRVQETQNLNGRPLFTSAESLKHSNQLFADVTVVLLGFNKDTPLSRELERALEKEGCESIVTRGIPENAGNTVLISRPSMIAHLENFKGYALGLPLIHYQWVLDSRSKQKILPWRRYELPVGRFVNNSTYSFMKFQEKQLNGVVPKPLLGHERALESLNVSILCEKGSQSKLLRSIAKRAGAIVVETPGLYSSDLSKRPQYLILDSKEKHKVYEKLTDMAKKRRCEVMSTFWMLESILKGKPLKPKQALEESIQRNCWSRRYIKDEWIYRVILLQRILCVVQEVARL